MLITEEVCWLYVRTVIICFWINEEIHKIDPVNVCRRSRELEVSKCRNMSAVSWSLTILSNTRSWAGLSLRTDSLCSSWMDTGYERAQHAPSRLLQKLQLKHLRHASQILFKLIYSSILYQLLQTHCFESASMHTFKNKNLSTLMCSCIMHYLIMLNHDTCITFVNVHSAYCVCCPAAFVLQMWMIPFIIHYYMQKYFNFLKLCNLKSAASNMRSHINSHFHE